MKDLGWVVQVFAVPDLHAQEFAAGLLHSYGCQAVQTRQSDTEHLVMVESADNAEARWVYELMLSIDIDATLVHRSRKPSDVSTDGPSDADGVVVPTKA